MSQMHPAISVRFWRRHPDAVCSYCLIPLSTETRTIDHIVPRSLGGSSSLLNLQPLCRACNNWKSDKIRVPHIALGPQYAASLHANGYHVTSMAASKLVPFKPDHARHPQRIWFVVGDPVRHLLNCFHFDQPETGE